MRSSTVGNLCNGYDSMRRRLSALVLLDGLQDGGPDSECICAYFSFVQSCHANDMETMIGSSR